MHVDQHPDNPMGLPHGKDYRPFLKVGHSGSKGTGTNVPGITTGRPHVCLSNTETRYFYVLEFAPGVVDIREQYPIHDAEGIADRLYDDRSDIYRNEIPTLDFVVTAKRKSGFAYVARSVKLMSDLSNVSTLKQVFRDKSLSEKFGMPWKLVTDEDLKGYVADNAQLLHGWVFAFRATGDFDEYAEVSNSFGSLLIKHGPGCLWGEAIAIASKKAKISEDEGRFRTALAIRNRALPINWNKELLLEKPFVLAK